jgi:hypothetical protein
MFRLSDDGPVPDAAPQGPSSETLNIIGRDRHHPGKYQIPIKGLVA